MTENINDNFSDVIEDVYPESENDSLGDTNAGRNQRYQGYDVKLAKKKSNKKDSWFYRILLMSVIISFIVILIICAVLYLNKKKTQSYFNAIDKANNLENIIKGHDNVKIDSNYSHLVEGNDYTDTRRIRYDEDEQLESVFIRKGSAEAYSEVFSKEQLYRNNGSYTTYYGITKAQSDEFYKEELEKGFFKTNGSEKIVATNETDSVVSLTATINVETGDYFNTVFGFEDGSIVERIMIFDKNSKVVTSVTDSVNDEQFYSYNLTYDKTWKKPKFFRRLSRKTDFRKCFVYYDIGGDEEEKYTFEIPYDVYFDIPETEEFKVYMNQECTREFSHFQFELQNPTGSMTLYMKRQGK